MNREAGSVIRLLLLALPTFVGCGPPRVGTFPETHTAPRNATADRDATRQRSLAEIEGRTPTFRERQLITRLVLEAERTRGLRFQSEVPIRIQTREEALRQLFRDLDEEELNKTKSVYSALGLLPAELELRQLLERVLGEQVAGYYDSDLNLLILREEILQALEGGQQDEEHVPRTIIHELVHALQDQHLELSAGNDEETESDTENAYKSLIEGDAMLAMIGFQIEAQGMPLELLTSDPSRIRRILQSAEGEAGNSELENAPAILRVTLLSSYTDGLVYCAVLHRSGGWAAINNAHRARPVSTEQVLHPDRYFAGELPDEITIPELTSFEAAGYESFHRDRLGELEFRVYFGQADDTIDEPAAAGWSGDQLVAYRRGAEVAIVWFSAWDNEQEAREAEQAARRVAGDGDPVHRAGRALLIMRAVPNELRAEVLGRFRAFSQGLPKTPPTQPAS